MAPLGKSVLYILLLGPCNTAVLIPRALMTTPHPPGSDFLTRTPPLHKMPLPRNRFRRNDTGDPEGP